jgi:DNA-binding transcriptional MerR regulator
MLTIGDFSRMTQLSVKTLRHYQDVGLVAPHHVDPSTGYRFYSLDQVPAAQVVRRLRALDMPVADVRSVLAATPDERTAVIAAHLGRLEARLASTQAAVEALRTLLDRPTDGPPVRHRSVPATTAIAIHADVDRDELPQWFAAAMTELLAQVESQGLSRTGAPGGLYGFDVFATDRGAATVFIPSGGRGGGDGSDRRVHRAGSRTRRAAAHRRARRRRPRLLRTRGVRHHPRDQSRGATAGVLRTLLLG